MDKNVSTKEDITEEGIINQPESDNIAIMIERKNGTHNHIIIFTALTLTLNTKAYKIQITFLGKDSVPIY